jgi:hypothetical protein
MTRPWRRMTRHLLQIFLTLGLTFTGVPHLFDEPTPHHGGSVSCYETDGRLARHNRHL